MLKISDYFLWDPATSKSEPVTFESNRVTFISNLVTLKNIRTFSRAPNPLRISYGDFILTIVIERTQFQKSFLPQAILIYLFYLSFLPQPICQTNYEAALLFHNFYNFYDFFKAK